MVIAVEKLKMMSGFVLSYPNAHIRGSREKCNRTFLGTSRDAGQGLAISIELMFAFFFDYVKDCSIYIN